MTSFPTLPTGPLEHIAMDYARLREEGIRRLGRLTGAQWTDYNAHDPGITILEQLCYAITDLGYRIDHPMPDLLAGGGAGDALPGPEQILGGDPVTQADLRKLALDVEGIGNAWVLPEGEPELPFFFHQGSGELRLEADFSDLDARPVRLTGLQQLALRASDRLPGDQALAQVAGRVHARRGLGEDVTLALLATHEVWIQARIEVGPIDDPAGVCADIIAQIEAYLAPPVRFTTLSDARALGHRVDELFEGPTLAHGFLLGELPQLRRAVRASDLIHAIMDVPAVRTVRSLALATAANAPRERWVLEIPAGHVATLATGSELTLLRAGLPLRIDPAAVQARLEERRTAARASGTTSDARHLRPAPGRDRGLGRYRSVQYQLPAAYGVGALGLPATATATRQAQARQLAAYLLIFDQLLANTFAQLAHAHELLSPGSDGARSYFAGHIDDPRLHLDALIRTDPELHRAWLETAVGAVQTGADPLDRRKRFLAHLLARFAEQLGDHAQIGEAQFDKTSEADAHDDDATLIADRQAFLRQYPRLSAARGSGPDLFGEPDAPSGLESRLRLKLGLRDGLRFHLVEHVLLRPIAEDSHQRGVEGDPQVPLYAGVLEADPWSLQVSYVFAARPEGAPDDAFEQMVAQTILAETPAHLRPQLHWFDAADGEDHWSAFNTAWLAFRAAYRDYRAAKLRATLVPDEIHLRARDARDRVIDLLGFARSYPLRDVPMPTHLIVAPGTPATIRIEHSQQDVVYGLRDRKTGAAIVRGGAAIEATGDGGTIELVTPAIDADVDFRVLAVKLAGKDSPTLRREAWLHGTVRVEEGVDPTLVARIDQPLLDFRIDAPQPTDARITDFGAAVDVHVFTSQEGVVYTLVDDADHGKVLSEAPVIGTGGTIVLRSVAVAEDLDLRVHGSKAAGDPQKPELRTALLDLVLPLRVRANPALTVKFMSTAVVDHGAELTVRVSKSQKSARYQLWRRRVRDAEFLFADSPEATTLDLKTPDGRVVRVLRPPRPAVWQTPPGFEPVGEPRPGNGSALDLPIGELTDDTLVLVQASKPHSTRPLTAAETGAPIVSAMQMAQALVTLVRPDPARALRITTTVAGGKTVGPLLLEHGQPGVFYTLFRAGQDAPIGEPAYFHRRDEPDAGRNKGVEALRVEVDLVIVRDGAPDPTLAAPPAPRIEVGELALPASLNVRARKALTGLEAPLASTAELASVPAIAVVPPTVVVGAAAKIVVAASIAGERYLLLRAGEAVQALQGTGAAIELDTGPLADTTVFMVAVIRDGQVIVVERRVAVTVATKPGA